MSDETPTPMSDETLILQACRGDPLAFPTLYERYFARLCLFARRILDDAHLAEDVAQETLVRVLVALPRFDRTLAKAKTWIFTIARRLAVDAMRRRGFPRPLPETPQHAADWGLASLQAPDRHPTPEETAIAKELREVLLDCLNELRPEDREVVQLIYIEGFRFVEAAEILQVPQGTVASRSGRARAAALEALQRRGIEL